MPKWLLTSLYTYMATMMMLMVLYQFFLLGIVPVWARKLTSISRSHFIVDCRIFVLCDLGFFGFMVGVYRIVVLDYSAEYE